MNFIKYKGLTSIELSSDGNISRLSEHLIFKAKTTKNDDVNVS